MQLHYAQFLAALLALLLLVNTGSAQLASTQLTETHTVVSAAIGVAVTQGSGVTRPSSSQSGLVLPGAHEPTSLLPTTGGNCPSWLEEYASWHRANRGSPDASYLVLYCPVGVVCFGIGDRVKGMMILLRLAYIYKKVLIMVWDHPEPISNYLVPNSIDWTPDGLPQDVLDAMHSAEETPFDAHMAKRLTVIKELIQTGQHADAFRATKMVRAQLNLWFGMDMAGSDDRDFIRRFGRNQFGRCLFKFMFKRAAHLEAKANAKLQELYGNSPRPFTAWHWRLGGMVSEVVLTRSDRHPGKKELEYSKLRTLMSVLPCAEELTVSHGGPPLREHPLLLVTDHNAIRAWVATGDLRPVTTIPAKVVHMGSKFMDVAAHQDTWLDLSILSMADCLVHSTSGYSNVALWMSDTTCVRHYATCVAADEQRFARSPVK